LNSWLLVASMPRRPLTGVLGECQHQSGARGAPEEHRRKERSGGHRGGVACRTPASAGRAGCGGWVGGEWKMRVFGSRESNVAVGGTRKKTPLWPGCGNARRGGGGQVDDAVGVCEKSKETKKNKNPGLLGPSDFHDLESNRAVLGGGRGPLPRGGRQGQRFRSYGPPPKGAAVQALGGGRGFFAKKRGACGGRGGTAGAFQTTGRRKRGGKGGKKKPQKGDSQQRGKGKTGASTE